MTTGRRTMGIRGGGRDWRLGRRPAVGHVGIVMTVLLMTGLMLFPGRSEADVIAGAITSISTTTTQVDNGELVAFDCTWAVPDGSAPGDTFELTLPEELAWAGSRTFDLRSPEGDVVATAAVDSEGHVVFTLTDYVSSHRDVHGDCTFVTTFTSAGTGEPVDLDFEVGAEVITVSVGTEEECTTACVGSRDEAGKDMWWHDDAQTTTRSVIWAPPTRDDDTTVTITDLPGQGLELDCGSVEAHIGRQLSAAGKLTTPYDDTAFPAIITCTPERLVVTWESVRAGEYAEVRVNAAVTTRQETYENDGTVSFDGASTPVDSEVERTDAGGTGSGVVTTPPRPSPTATPTTPAATPAPIVTSPPATHIPTTRPEVEPRPGSEGPSPTTTPRVPQTLAYTGADVRVVLVVAGLLLVAGAALVARTRRSANPSRGRHRA